MISEALGGMWTSANVDPDFVPLEQFVAQVKLGGDFDSLDYTNLELEYDDAEAD